MAYVEMNSIKVQQLTPLASEQASMGFGQIVSVNPSTGFGKEHTWQYLFREKLPSTCTFLSKMR